MSANVKTHVISFNPTLVRLRSWMECKFGLKHPSFNPTLVRLRLPVKPRAVKVFRRFNPTLVRLRASIQSRKPLPSWFQSHAGSIEAVSEKDRSRNEIAVSIPRWFD